MKLLKTAMLVSLAFGTTGVALASTGGAGIYNTRHDYATRSNYLGTQTDRPGVANTAGQCMYCHTPHSAVTTRLLWNKAPATAGYNWDVSSTDGGTGLGTIAASYKGPSIKCLACHDGSVAIGDVALARGKLSASLNSFKVGSTIAGYTSVSATFGGQDASTRFVIGSGGIISGSHPIAVPYPFNQAVNTYNSSTTGANVVLSEFVANPHQVSVTSVGGGQTTSTKYPAASGLGNQNSYIKLYTENGGGVVTAGPTAGTTGMECSTCHDPHNKQTADDWMLRGTNNGVAANGYICTQCHIK